jgi:polysaccharide chain length determinant protein (PEP-CTERM system associated)
MKDFRKLHPVDYLKILWRRRWWALAVFAAVAVGVGVYAWRMPDVYRSESRILVEAAVIAQDYVRPSIRSTPEEQIAAIRAQVQSRSFLERMIQEFGLFGYGTDENFSMDRTVLALNKNIQILNTSRNTFSISFSAADPHMAQNFTRRMVETLIQSSNSSRKTRAVETDQFLDEQLRKTEQQLAAHENRIKQFKTTYLGALPEQSAANVNALTALSTQLSAVESALQQARDRQKLLDLRAQDQKRLSVLTQNILVPSTPTASPAGESISPVESKLEAKQAELAALSARYTPNHPDVVRLNREIEDLKRQSAAAGSEMTQLSPAVEPATGAAESQTEPATSGIEEILDFEDSTMKFEADSIKSEIAKREKEKENILAQIKAYQSKLNLAPAVEQELMALSREYDVLQRQYASLHEKKAQAQMTANLETNTNIDTYKIIDEANLPERPSFPNRLQILLIGLCAALVLGIAAAMGREMLDTTLVSEEEAAAVLNLPVLITISEVPRKEPKRLIALRGTARSA